MSQVRPEIDLAGLARREGQRFLAVDVSAPLEGLLRDGEMGVVNGEIEDDVDAVIGQEVLE